VLKFSEKGSKLIVIFILTVIVSGSILTYLSITHISNYRELLEKKISEEERDLTNRFSLDFQDNLDSLTLKLAHYIEHDSTAGLKGLKNIDSLNILRNYVVLDDKGAYMIPYFVSNELFSTYVSPKIFSNRLRDAENKEFIIKDFNSAELSYFNALKAAEIPSDSAHVYNAMGRLYVKMNLPQKAFDAYKTILTKFSSVSNSAGFPYVYFSVIKLLKISNKSNLDELHKLLLLFLNGLTDGTIPLNDSSEELLDSIVTWQVKSNGTLNAELFKKLIDKNKNSLSLIDNYKIPIENQLTQLNDDVNRELRAEFLPLKPSSGNSDELMLFFNHAPYSVGFVIGLNKLFENVLLKQPMEHLKFAYTIKIVEKADNNYLTNSNLITRTEFSPYFENSLLQVSLKNANIIDETVFRRQITYGIGLFLFLGVMALGLYLLIQDVNREKRMNKLRADFVSNVTHELKTPLTAINMFAEAMSMRQDNLDSKQKKYTTIIVKESEKLKRMINNILEFSKKENNKMSYKLERSNVTDIVSSTLKEMNYFLEINNIDVHLSIAPEIYATVYAEGIKQALSNLISNAIKYSSINKKLHIQLFKKNNEIFIEVEDFGIGIPKEELELIFEKFYRVNSNENETASGTGLGLTVTKDIIEEQHGKLLVESTLGKGSKFTIVLNPA
jgi:two-component system phosphate regulon sensor histidine kinase PhoR